MCAVEVEENGLPGLRARALRACSPPLVGPLRRRTAHAPLQLAAADIGVVVAPEDRHAGDQFVGERIHALVDVAHHALLEFQVLAPAGVGEALHLRELQAVHLAEAGLAVVADTAAEIAAPVVVLAEAHAVEEDPVGLVDGQRLAQHLQRIVLQPRAARAGLVGAGVFRRAAGAVDDEPIRMGVIDRLERLRGVEAAEIDQALGVGGLDAFGDEVVLQVGVLVLVLELRRIEGHDAADVRDDGGPPERLYVARDLPRILQDVDLAKVGLDDPVILLPPAVHRCAAPAPALRRRRRRQGHHEARGRDRLQHAAPRRRSVRLLVAHPCSSSFQL
ncbi:hypothetical protein LRS04_01600 [Phenylobacterium sp. J367]|nr:hypothetical protein [Phenylobacterium sp. J367]MCR5877213.1 hypothetical protein [Phenylobacterium sp. J367]